MVEKLPPIAKDSIFTIIGLINGLDDKVANGILCAKDVVDVWERECALDNRRQPVKLKNMPFSLRDELENRAVNGRVTNLCVGWDPRYGIALPRIASWLLDRTVENDRRITFEGLEMDRAAFVRELLEHPFFGVRVRREIMEFPYLLNFLPEEERWERLAAAVREHASVCGWYWPAYTAENWSKERTIEVVRELIKDPEVAGGFLLGEGAPAFAWRLFWDQELFFYVLAQAGRLAPYELALRHQWIATCIGDRLSHPNGPSCLDDRPEGEDHPWYGWWMDHEIVHRDFAPKGERLMSKLVDDTLDGLLERDVSELSAFSQYFVRQVKGVCEKIDDPQTGKKLTELLMGVPDSLFSGRLIVKLLESCKLEYLGQVYRWALSAEKKVNPARFHVLVRLGDWQDTAAYQKAYPDDLAQNTHIYSGIEVAMQTLGWQIHQTAWHENVNKSRWDLQVVVRGERVTRVYGIWWGRVNWWGDSVPTYPKSGTPPQFKVLIPPGFDPGKPSYSAPSGKFEIYNVGDTLMFALPWSYTYLSKCGVR